MPPRERRSAWSWSTRSLPSTRWTGRRRGLATSASRRAIWNGSTMDHVAFYVTLAIWKLAILLEGSYSRHLAGTTDDPFFASLREGVPALARSALAVARGEITFM